MLSGIINLDKPAGVTSHDVVDAVRRMAHQRKVGHAGTLDPMATGVLLVCLGAATRVAEFLMAGRKRYRAGIVFGAATTTYDAEGQVTDCGGRGDFALGEIEAALARFVGRIEQLPPAFSAIKQQGEPLYRRARRGESVDLKPRVVEIHDLAVLDWAPPGPERAAPLLTIEVTCSSGTYIRSLAHDLGRSLGSGAYLASLVRLQSGRFRLEDAVSLGRLEEAFLEGEEASYLLPADEALLHWPALIVSEADARRIKQGLPVAGDAAPARPGPDDARAGTSQARCRAYSHAGEFLAILAYRAEAGQWWPDKVFADPDVPSSLADLATPEQ